MFPMPWSACQADLYMASREASMPMAMSASMKATAWCLGEGERGREGGGKGREGGKGKGEMEGGRDRGRIKVYFILHPSVLSPYCNQWLPKCLPLQGIFGGLVHSSLCQTHCTCSHLYMWWPGGVGIN